jgi:tetratricopeptide (TPR) repeat protein
MKYIGIAIMLIALFTFGHTFLAAGQVDGSANGQPTAGKVDTQAVAELERASALLAEDGKEREALRAALPLVEIFEADEDYDHLVDCLFLVGEAYYHLAEWANAEQFMQLAADLGYRYFADEMSSYPLKVVGEAQFEQNKPEAALATFTERVQKIRAANETSELPGALFDVGGLLINLGREQEALPKLAEAAEANRVEAAALTAAGATASEEDKEANRIDQAEIAYHSAIANFHLEQYDEAYTSLQEAYKEFTGLSVEAQHELSDRLVAVLDDLVLVCEKLGLATEQAQYQAERDKLNQ